MTAVRIVSGKERGGILVALGAYLDYVVAVDCRSSVLLGQNIMSRVAIRTAGSPLRETKPVSFAVIAFQVCLNGRVNHIIAFHHFLIGMTFNAGRGVEHTTFVGIRTLDFFDSMKPMAIAANSGIHVACKHSLSVDGGEELFFIFVAINTLLEHGPFVFFLGGNCVDIIMAIDTGNVLLLMDATRMFGILLLVAAGTIDPIRFFADHMLPQVCFFQMAACTAAFPVGRGPEGIRRDPVTVATETIHRVYCHSFFRERCCWKSEQQKYQR